MERRFTMARTQKREEARNLRAGLRKVVLAVVGAAVMAKESAQDVARKCVARGQKVEPQIRKTLDRLVEQRRKAVDQAGKLAEKVDGRIRNLSRYLPVVTRHDLAELVRRLDSLSHKVDALAKSGRKGR